jgi:hypothetical protein
MASWSTNEDVQRYNVARLKNTAFTANRQAKLSKDETRAAFYRKKVAAINALLRAGFASVNSVDWWCPDPILGISFEGGGSLHMPMSCLDLGAMRVVRHQLNGCLTPQNAAYVPTYSEVESRAAAWN